MFIGSYEHLLKIKATNKLITINSKTLKEFHRLDLNILVNSHNRETRINRFSWETQSDD